MYVSVIQFSIVRFTNYFWRSILCFIKLKLSSLLNPTLSTYIFLYSDSGLSGQINVSGEFELVWTWAGYYRDATPLEKERQLYWGCRSAVSSSQIWVKSKGLSLGRYLLIFHQTETTMFITISVPRRGFRRCRRPSVGTLNTTQEAQCKLNSTLHTTHYTSLATTLRKQWVH